MTPFENNDYEKCKSLLLGGLSPNFQRSNGESLLHLTSTQGSSQIVDLLLTYRADPHLQVSLLREHDTIQLLTKQNNLKQDEAGNTPLHRACAGGHLECLKLLLEKGNAHLNVRNYSLQTPLHFACRFKNEKGENFATGVKFLCQAGARVIPSIFWLIFIIQLLKNINCVLTKNDFQGGSSRIFAWCNSSPHRSILWQPRMCWDSIRLFRGHRDKRFCPLIRKTKIQSKAKKKEE